jgi:rare lipoprotein A
VTTTSPLVVTSTTIRVPLLPEDDPMAGPHTIVSWYGSESGSHTANGDVYDPAGLTFAHKTMRFGTRVRFCGPLGCVVATCTDRGPFVAGRSFDLSRGAFARVAPLSAGVAELAWEVVE